MKKNEQKMTTLFYADSNLPHQKSTCDLGSKKYLYWPPSTLQLLISSACGGHQCTKPDITSSISTTDGTRMLSRHKYKGTYFWSVKLAQKTTKHQP